MCLLAGVSSGGALGLDRGSAGIDAPAEHLAANPEPLGLSFVEAQPCDTESSFASDEHFAGQVVGFILGIGVVVAAAVSRQ
jgi:hypothetical protein